MTTSDADPANHCWKIDWSTLPACGGGGFVYDNANNCWKVELDLEDLQNVLPDGIVAGDGLIWDGTNWVPSNDITDWGNFPSCASIDWDSVTKCWGVDWSTFPGGDHIEWDPVGELWNVIPVPPVEISDTAPDFKAEYFWWNSDTGELFLGYKDPSGDEYWVSASRPGDPGADGKDGDPVIISQDTPPPVTEDYIWFNTATGEAFFGYVDPSGDAYWVSLSKPGEPGADGKDGDPVVISQDTPPPVTEDYIWFDTSKGEAFFGYVDPSGDAYWVSLSKPGAPGADGKDGNPVIISQDTPPPVVEDNIWFNTGTGEAFFGYVDPSGDAYWVALSKPGAPGADGTDGADGTPVITSSDNAPSITTDHIWFNTEKGEAFFGYVDPSGDAYWVSMSKPYAKFNSTLQSNGGIEIQEADINQLLLYGQSLSLGNQSGPAISTSQPYSNISFANGPADQTTPFADLVEVGQESPCSGAANYASRLIATENGIVPTDHIIHASTAGNGGKNIDFLDKPASGGDGTSWYETTFLENVRRVSSESASNRHVVHAVAWIQGEADKSSTFDYYATKLIKLQADAERDIKSISKQQSPVYFITYQTSSNIFRDTLAGANVPLAQLHAVKTSSKFFLSTPLYHIPANNDDIHLPSTSYKLLGAYIGRVYKQLVVDRREPDWLNPISAVYIDNVVRIRFEVPTLPLLLDTVELEAVTDFGFKIEDGGSSIPLDSISISSTGNEVLITPQTSLSADAVVRYALDYAAPSNVSAGAGNLRDSTAETVTIDGTSYPLFHVAPHFSLNIIPLIE